MPETEVKNLGGRPVVGPTISIRLEPELLAAVDTEAARWGQSRAATIRVLLARALALHISAEPER